MGTKLITITSSIVTRWLARRGKLPYCQQCGREFHAGDTARRVTGRSRVKYYCPDCGLAVA